MKATTIDSNSSETEQSRSGFVRDLLELVKARLTLLVLLTTAVGFVSFAFSPLAPVQAFGIFTGLGVLFSLFYSLTVIPAMLTLINPERS